jgi:gliding motility-associated-like protein
MKKYLTYFTLFIAIASTTHQVNAQTEYLMQNLSISECEGILTDSEEGLEEGQYGHNEDFTFTICVDDADEIAVTFDFFATEENLDLLNVYDGPNTSAPLIASLSGIINPPPVLVATSGCITFHFTSDESIAASGWSAHWEVTVNEPQLPEIQMSELPDCPLASHLFELDIPIPCDQITVDALSLIGPGGFSVNSVNILDCDSTTQLAQTFEVGFSQEIDIPGTFRLFFEGELMDACDETHPFSTNVLFEVANCPIQVEITELERACPGDCGRLEAVVTGNDNGDFNFNWSHSILDASEAEVCTDSALTVFVEVTDLTSGSTATDTFEYIPFSNPTINNPFLGDTVCSSRGDHIYSVTPNGGAFYSSVIPDWERESGRYQFWRWNGASDLNRDIIEYVDPNGCTTADTLWIYPVWAGSVQASCQGSGDFLLNGGNPPGGIWTGEHTTEDGIFSPVESGSFSVSYTAPNGWVSWKTVRVLDTIIMPDIDTICRTQRVFLEAEPYGGRWSGPGIVNSVNGRLDGWRPSSNTTHTYIYELEGCQAEMEIFIQDIQAGPDRTRCLGDSLLFVAPAGNWNGPAPYIDSIQAFDISQLGVGTHNFTYSAFGCSDRFELNLVDVRIEEENTLFFCLINDTIHINPYINFYPSGGSLSGPGIIEIDSEYYLNPSIAGSGTHAITWEALGCSDSLHFEVEAPAEIPDYSFCELSEASLLTANPAGGSWRGPGLLDEAAGLFDPQSLPIGFYTLYYIAPSGCETATEIEIFGFEEVSISGLQQQYCYSDTIIDVELSPPGGEFRINGQLSPASFSPADLGTGNHELVYRRGSGACASSERRFIAVLAPIEGEVFAARDTLCPGESTEIQTVNTGGFGNLTTTWNRGLGFGVSHIIRPEESGWYRVRVEDGCSLPFEDSLFIFQYEPFSFSTTEGPQVCFEDSTFVEIELDSADYLIDWQLQDSFFGPRYTGPPGLYDVLITELNSSCQQEATVELPGASPLQANMSLTPNQDCIDNIENQVEIIDLSIGYSMGTVDFGDGSPIVNIRPGDLITHDYLDTGTFTIQFAIQNELGCTDTIQDTLCVENIARIYVPNVFSPNGDGRNDEFSFDTYGIRDVEWSVYNRYGDQLFFSRSEHDSWDGTFRSKRLEQDVYVVRITYVDSGTGEEGSYHGSVTLIR